MKKQEPVEEKQEGVEETTDNPHADCQKQIEELQNQYKRILADYQNLEKRVREEKADHIRLANQSLLMRLLPTLDTLEMAAAHSTDQTLTLVISLYKDALKAEGVEKIETIGKQFDPSIMEAVEIIKGDANIVIEERRPGFMLHGKLLRPAEVAVGGKE